ncbi:MAG: ABC transporter ATP-binding protein [Gemmatimonadetes bacterium]|nr:ABC transporter ATP-binding protein [Gemmatimonadota bacterium]
MSGPPFLHGLPRFARSPRNTDHQPTWSERLQALRYVGPLLSMVYQTHKGYTVGIVALRLVRGVVPLAGLWVGKLIIDAVVHAVGAGAGAPVDWRHLGQLVGLELAIGVFGEALARGSSLLESLLGDLFSNRISVQLLRHAATLDLAQFEDPDTYDHLERARRQTVGRIGLLGLVLTSAQDLITLASLAVALVLYVPWLMVLLAISVVPAFLGETHFASLGYSLLFRWTPERRLLDYLRWVGATDTTVKEVKLFGLAPFLVERYDRLAKQFYEENKALSTKRATVSTLLALVGTLGYYGAYVVIIYLTVIGHRSAAGLFTIGVLTFLAASFRQSRELIQRFLMSLSQIYENALYLSDLFVFFALEPAIRSKPGARPVPVPIREGFVFEHVSFRYGEKGRWAVRDLSFTLAPNESVALVGENGAGKTTLVKLLARLYDPSEGRILLDGVDLREYDVDSLRAHIGVIFQDFVRYDLIFRENIGVGQVGEMENKERVAAAAGRSLADTVAGRLEKGFEHQLGRRFEGGVELSGGEWQKVALARAYMRDAQVVILDEPTAALDARAEYEVFLRFTELTRDRIAVIISHRFSTVRMADRIIVLQQGELVEQGTHEELLIKSGLYSELFNLQAAGYR